MPKETIEIYDVDNILKKVLTLGNYFGKITIGIRGTFIEYVEPDRILKVNDIEGYLEE
jgi:hypothetical protein